VAAAEAAHVPGEVAAVEAAHVASAEMAAAEAAHMASAAHVATATSVSAATATAGLCISGKKAAGKHCTCQNHHHSSSHGILLWNGRDFSTTGPDAGAQTPTLRWTEDDDAYLSFLLNSHSMIRIDHPARLEPKVSVRQIKSWTLNGGDCARYFSNATWTGG
jgi:hypothetical protein